MKLKCGIHPNVSLGPELRYRLGRLTGSSAYSYTVDGEVIESDESTVDDETNEAFNRFDFGASGGVGFAYPVKSIRIFAEARCHLGLSNLISADAFDGDFDGRIENRAVSINIGVLYKLGKK